MGRETADRIKLKIKNQNQMQPELSNQDLMGHSENADHGKGLEGRWLRTEANTGFWLQLNNKRGRAFWISCETLHLQGSSFPTSSVQHVAPFVYTVYNSIALRYSHCVQPISRTSFRTFFYPKGVGAMVGLAPTPTQPKLQSGQRPTTCSLWAHVHTRLHVHRHVPSGGTKTSLIAGSNGLCLPEKVEATEPHMCRLESWGSCVQVTRQVVNSCPKLRSPSRTSHSESRSKNIIAKLIVWG